jgi:hypothetical protein
MRAGRAATQPFRSIFFTFTLARISRVLEVMYT